LIGEKRARSA
jgi:hypothetical protein